MRLFNCQRDDGTFKSTAQCLRVYVDAVLNHMTGLGGNGTGDAGSYYDTDNLIYTGVPYGAQDFTPCSQCSSENCKGLILFIVQREIVLNEIF